MKRVNIISTVVQRGISGEKISTGNTFIGSGVNINDIKRELSKDFMSLEKFKSYWEVKTDPFGNKYLYSLFHIATNKGVTMYSSTDTQKIPSILESIPTAGYDDIQARGLIAFNSNHFVINNGVVSAIQGSAGLDVEQLEDYLTSNKYTTEDWVKQYVVDVNTGNITAITKQMVIDALEYTPYDASNPNGYITSATLDGYLPLSGGTLTAINSDTALILKGNVNGSWVAFSGNDDTFYGSIGVKSDKEPYMYHNSVAHKFWHEGNDGSGSGLDADMLDGREGNGYTYHINGVTTVANKYIKITTLPASLGGTYDSVTISGTIGGWYSYDKADLKITVGRRDGVTFKGYSYPKNGWDIYVNDNGELLIYLSSQYCAWDLSVTCNQAVLDYKVDYTPTDTNFTKMSDSSYIVWFNNNGSVASATKLQTPRTIWGQPFDGSGDVNGVLTLSAANNVVMYLTSSNNGECCIVYTGSDGYRWAAGKGTSAGSNTYGIWSGTLDADVLTCLSSGNVGIGTTDPLAKLHVYGGATPIICESNASESSIYFVGAGTNSEYKWAIGKGVWSLSGKFGIGEYNTNNALYMQIGIDGNVGIGVPNYANPSAKLHVAGNILATGGITTNDSLTINGINIKKSQDGVLYLDGNLVVKGGVTMYGTDETSAPSILDSLPKASYGSDNNNKGIASFDGNYFRVDDGYVSLIADNVGINQSVLEEILATKDFATKTDLSGYLPLSGGAIGGWVHIMNNKSAEGTLQITGVSVKPRIRFEGNFSWGYLGFGGANKPCYYDNALNEYNLIHSGNIGSQSVNYATSSGSSTKLSSAYGNSTSDDMSSRPTTANNRWTDKSVRYYLATALMTVDKPITDGKILHLSWDNTGWDSQLFVPNTTAGSMQYRATNGYATTWESWKTVVDSNNIVYYNAGSATKLQTARTIWGQSFDGSGNVNGVLTLSAANNVVMYLTSSNNGECCIVYTGSDGYRWAAGKGTSAGSNTYGIWSGTLDADVLTCLSSGNVGIGTTSPSAKLHVYGGATPIICESNASESSIYFVGAGTNSEYKWAIGKGVWSLSGKFGIGEYNTNNALYMQIGIDGNVGIGVPNYANPSAKLHVAGNILATGGITMYSQLSLKNVVDERGLSLSELSAIKPTRYTWKDKRDNRIHFGGIADDIQQVLPEVVYKTADGTLTMDYGNAGFAIAASLIKPVVDHEQRIKALERENELLKQELNRLRA